ncbi:DUF3592 domain-containing protein [bacterium]|nr:MAG: DUF3592 domain-containing protein [bacterium]
MASRQRDDRSSTGRSPPPTLGIDPSGADRSQGPFPPIVERRGVRRVPFDRFPPAPRQVRPIPAIALTVAAVWMGYMFLQVITFYVHGNSREHYRQRAFGPVVRARVVALGEQRENGRREVKVAFRTPKGETSQWGTVPGKKAESYRVGTATWATFDPNDVSDPFVGTERKDWPLAPVSPLQKVQLALFPFFILTVGASFFLALGQQAWVAKAGAFRGRISSRTSRTLEYEWDEDGSPRSETVPMKETLLPHLQKGEEVVVLVDGRGRARLAERFRLLDVNPLPAPEEGLGRSEAVP